MKAKKIITGVLSVTMLAMPAVSTLGAEYFDRGEIIPISAPWEEEIKANYQSITGTVVDIQDHGEDGSKKISIGNEDEITANIIISKDTYLVDEAKIEVGSEVTWFFDASKPMILIYPPQYYPEVVAVEKEGQNLKLDLFDEDLLSSDGSLKLELSEETSIVLPDDSPYAGDLADKKLLIIYSASSRSIPALTSPDKVVVLGDEESAVYAEDLPLIIDDVLYDVSTMDIVVNDRIIDAPAAYNNDRGEPMVPLRPIAEAIHFDVFWDDAQKAVRLGKYISLKIGEDKYSSADSTIELGTAPEIVEGHTYVPLSFFREVLKVNNAYAFEHHIVIDDGEPMR